MHNGSSLFTGDAGQGESNIRRWIIENDWLEAIVALPLNMFYNTGIATYIWVLTNRKPAHRKGKVQLIDATQWFKPLRKNLGKKNCELSDDDIERICDTFLAFKETEQSKIFPNAAFGYWKVTVERPLRLKGIDPERAYTPKEIKALKEEHGVDADAPPVIRKIHKTAGQGRSAARPVRGDDQRQALRRRIRARQRPARHRAGAVKPMAAGTRRNQSLTWFNIIRSFTTSLFGNIAWQDTDRIRRLIATDIPNKVARMSHQNAKKNSIRSKTPASSTIRRLRVSLLD